MPKYDCDHLLYIHLQGDSANPLQTKAKRPTEDATDSSTADYEPPPSESGEKGFGSRFLSFVKGEKTTPKDGASDVQPKVPTQNH